MLEIEQAARLAEQLLATDLPVRWQHVRCVADKASKTGARILPPREAGILTAAAWLHDIGYAPKIRKTGFHPLDGAEFLREAEFSIQIVSLVANHSAAQTRAREEKIPFDSLLYPREITPLADALWFSDMTTGPHGEDFSFAERMAEIRVRHNNDPKALQAMQHTEPELAAAVQRTLQRLTEMK